MADKIVYEMEGRSDKLEKTLKDLQQQVNTIGNSVDYTDNLEKNINVYSTMIKKAEELRRVVIATSKDIESMSAIPAGGTNKSRELAQKKFDNLQSQAGDALGYANSTSGKFNRRTETSAYGSTNRYYEPRINEPSIMAVQRENARYSLSEERRRYNVLKRDAGTANRSTIQSNRRLDTTIKTGGFITPAERATAQNNLNAQRNILTDNGRYSDTSGRINSLTSQMESNNALRSNIKDSVNSIKEKGNLGVEDTNRIEQLRAQGKLLEVQNQGIKSYIDVLNNVKNNYSKLENTMQSPNAKYAPNSGLEGLVYNNSRKMANGVVYGGMASVIGLSAKGMGTINQNQPYTRAIGANNGTYDSRGAQLAAQNAGMRYGLTGSDMLSSEMAYMQGRGYTSKKDLSSAGVASGTFAKVNGISIDASNELTSVVGQNTQGSDSQSLKDIQNTFYGALKQAGLDNRSSGQSSQLSSILGNFGSLRGGDVSAYQMQGQVAMQAKLGSTGNSTFLGQNGANFMNQMNSGIIGQGANSKFMQFALMNSNPGKFNGSPTGYANMIRATQQGLTGDNLKSIIGVGDMMGAKGMSQEDRNAFMSQTINNQFGTKLTADSMGDLYKLSKSGGLDGLDDKQVLDKLNKEGSAAGDTKLSSQQKSSDAQYDKGQSALEKSSTELGNLTRQVTALGLTMTGGSAAVQVLGAAAIGAAASLGKIAASSAISGALKGGSGSGSLSGGIAAGGASVASGGSWMSKLKGKVAGSKIMNSGAVTGILGSSAVAKGAGVLSKGKGIISSVGSKGMSMLGKASPYLQAGATAIDLVSDISQGAGAKKISGDVGGGIGAVAGGLLGLPFGPLGSIAGSFLGNMAGNAIGSGIGGMFGSDSSKRKDDESLTNKKIQAEQMRSKNIKEDDTFVNKYGREVSKKEIFSGGGSSNSVSADDSTSPFDSAKNTGKLGAAGGSANSSTSSETRVVVSGEIKHSGDVTDMSQVNVSAQGVLSDLFSGMQPNETTRVR